MADLSSRQKHVSPCCPLCVQNLPHLTGAGSANWLAAQVLRLKSAHGVVGISKCAYQLFCKHLQPTVTQKTFVCTEVLLVSLEEHTVAYSDNSTLSVLAKVGEKMHSCGAYCIFIMWTWGFRGPGGSDQVTIQSQLKGLLRVVTHHADINELEAIVAFVRAKKATVYQQVVIVFIHHSGRENRKRPGNADTQTVNKAATRLLTVFTPPSLTTNGL